MTQAQWNAVMETNLLLHASYVRKPLYGIAKKVERAMYLAFELKPRQFHDFTASLDNKDIIPPMVFISFSAEKLYHKDLRRVTLRWSWRTLTTSTDSSLQLILSLRFYGLLPLLLIVRLHINVNRLAH